MEKIWRNRIYTETEEEAIDWLKNTDTIQLSKMELLAKFTEHWIAKYDLVDGSGCGSCNIEDKRCKANLNL